MRIFETASHMVRPFIGLAVVGGLAVGACRFTEETPEKFLKSEAIPDDWSSNVVMDWITPDATAETYVERVQTGTGEMRSNTYRGQITSLIRARAEFTSEINLLLVDFEYDSTQAIKEGLIVNRIELPGIPMLDTLSFSDGTMKVTQFEDGKEVGIDITNAKFAKLKPEVAIDTNGELTCPHDVSDKDFSGCITSDIQSESFLSAIDALASDPNRQIRNAVNMLVNEYGKIEKCHFDNIIIPAMNKQYAKYGLPLIEGESQYQQAMATLLRAFWRDGSASAIPPNLMIFNITGSYEPEESLKSRLEGLKDVVDFPFDVPEDYTQDYCARDPAGTIPLEFHELAGGFGDDMAYIAIMGLENVPEDYNPKLRTFTERKPVQEAAA